LEWIGGTEKGEQPRGGEALWAHCPAGKTELCVTAAVGRIGLAGCLVAGNYFVAVNRIEHFAPVDRHFLRGLNPEANLVSSDLDDDDRNVIIDDNTLVLLTG
jgi:hypothetical protein